MTDWQKKLKRVFRNKELQKALEQSGVRAFCVRNEYEHSQRVEWICCECKNSAFLLNIMHDDSLDFASFSDEHVECRIKWQAKQARAKREETAKMLLRC